MRRLAIRAIVTALAMALGAGSAMAQVKTTAGLVAGTTSADGNVRVFRGIPFAAAPVGDLRWTEPRPAPPWDGVRDATEFGRAVHAGPDFRGHHVSEAGERGLPQSERLDARGGERAIGCP